MVKVKSFMATMVVLMVSAGAFFWLLGDPTHRGEEEVSVAVTWLPGRMPQDVNITLTVNGIGSPQGERTSPWGAVFKVPFGAEVIVSAHSFHPATTMLSCIILRNKVVQPHGRDTRPGPGSVKCISP